jgi:hypothetical protein
MLNSRFLGSVIVSLSQTLSASSSSLLPSSLSRLKRVLTNMNEEDKFPLDDSNTDGAGIEIENLTHIIHDDEDEIEWEEWRPNEISFHHHMLAGSIAGLAEHITFFPVDTIKTNLQCQKCGSTSPFNCAARMIRSEGVFRLWRGVTATFAGCIPGIIRFICIFVSCFLFNFISFCSFSLLP